MKRLLLLVVLSVVYGSILVPTYCFASDYSGDFEGVEISTPDDDDDDGTDTDCSGGGGIYGGGCDGGGGEDTTGSSLQEENDVNSQTFADATSAMFGEVQVIETEWGGTSSLYGEYSGGLWSSAGSVTSEYGYSLGYASLGESILQAAVGNLGSANNMVTEQQDWAINLRYDYEKINLLGQGPELNDPVIIASGVESFSATDMRYSSLGRQIRIERTYKSNLNASHFSFGTGWVFNYDTQLVVGRKPLIKERELLTAGLNTQTTQLQNNAEEQLGNITSSLNIAGTELTTLNARLQQMQNVQAILEGYINNAKNTLVEASQLADEAEAIKDNGTQVSLDNAAAARGYANGIQEIIAGLEGTYKTISCEIGDYSPIEDCSPPFNDALNTALGTRESATQLVTTAIPAIQSQMMQHKSEIDNLAAVIAEHAAEAAAEARAEEARFPNDPYPTDPSVYFGNGYVKVIDEEGTPVMYQANGDGVYYPVSDSGSYTSIIRETESNYALVAKNGEVTEFGKTGTGRAPLAAMRDTNGNETRFTKVGDVLTITDAVGRKTTITYTAAGHIATVMDPQNNIHSYSYVNSLLTGYTDPQGYTWSYGYDADNRLISRTDPNGGVYQYVYDDQGRVVSEIDKAGFAISYSYDPENQVTTETDRRGFSRQYHYNEAHRVELIVQPDGSSVSFTYDERNNITSRTDENGITTSYTYNAFNDVVSVTDGLGNITTYTYEPQFNKIASITDPLGRLQSFAYDGKGNLLQVTHPDGTSRSFTYNGQGLPISAADENGNVSGIAYDEYGYQATVTNQDGTKKSFVNDILGRVLTATDENGYATSFHYDPNGNLVRTIDPLGGETHIDYDALGHKIQVTNALGNAVQYQYTVRGNLAATIDPLGNTEARTYDPSEKLVRVISPDSTGVEYAFDSRERVVAETRVPANLVTQYVYDAGGRKTSVIDANGNTTSYNYDALGRVVAVTNGEGHTVASEYDAAGNLLTVIDGNGNPRTYAYDQRNRLVAETDGIGNTTSYRHDGVGNVITKQKPDGSVIVNSYDARNRLVAVTYPDGTFKQFNYDNVSNMIGLSYGETSETRQYDPLGRLVLTYDKDLGQVDYDYDLVGNRTTVIDPAEGTMSYEYDVNNRVAAFTDPEGGRTSYTYDSMGRIVNTVHPNNTETIQQYDAAGNLVSIATYGDHEGVVSAYSYTYDAVGNRLSMTDREGAVTGYQYDTIYQLIAVDYPQREWEPELSIEEKTNGTTNGKGEKNGHFKNRCDITLDCLPSMVTYSYDGAGNRLTMTDDWQTTRYSYNAANQLEQAGTVTFAYDANGNRIQKSDNGEVANYSYTYDDLLAQVDSPNGDMTGYGYDALNRRIYKVDQTGDTVAYLYDGLDVFQEVTGQVDQKIATYYRANGKILTRQEFNISQDDTTLYQNRPTGRQLYYSYDGLGSTAALTDHNGRLVTSYQYDAYGQMTGGDIKENSYTFTSQRFDEESGLYHFHFRKYDPVVGVWTTADPIGVMGGVNVYGYVENDPVNFVDPKGLDATTINLTINIPFLGGIEVGLVEYYGSGIENRDFGVYGTYKRPVGGIALAKGTLGASTTFGGRENFDGEDLELAVSAFELGLTAGGFQNNQTPTSMGFDIGPQLGVEANATVTWSLTVGDLARGFARLIYGDGGSIFDNSTYECAPE